MAEENLITTADLSRAREIDFAYRFSESLNNFLRILETARRIAKKSGTLIRAYKATGTLQDGNVPEGDIIPLSKYTVEPVSFEEIKIQKWRKATSIEAISEYGYDQAATMTLDEMLKDVQKGIRTKFFAALAKGTASTSGTNFQKALANAWGQLQVAYEDIDFEAVYFMNPLDIAEYLGNAQIVQQTAFGMTYVENFLGLGTVFFTKNVPQGTIYGTAKENLVLYYLDVNDGDIGERFTFTTDVTGLIGVHESANYENLTAPDVVVSGVILWPERIDGVVVATIGDDATGA